MKIAHICPIAMLDQVIRPDHDYHLILVSQVLESPRYAQFYRERVLRGQTVILDNDAYENGASHAVPRIIEAYNLVRPSVVVLPDKLSANGPESYHLADQGMRALLSAGMEKVDFMAVPHGHTIQEYVTCAIEMSSIPLVKSLGIYKRLKRDLRVEREWLVEELGFLPVDFHLLGATDNLRELASPILRGRCTGLDTCRIVQEGLRGRDLSLETKGGYEGRQEGYFNLPPQLGASLLAHVRGLINYWDDITEGKYDGPVYH